jgi:hypothetical protein
MDWREKWTSAAFFLVLIAWGVEISQVWPVLVAHLTPNNWIMIALIHLAVLLALIAAYGKAPKGTPARSDVLLITVFVIISWAMNLSLMGKIGGH